MLESNASVRIRICKRLRIAGEIKFVPTAFPCDADLTQKLFNVSVPMTHR
jgi:hypothetical protein